MNQLEALFQQGRYREVVDRTQGSADPLELLMYANAALELGQGDRAQEVLDRLLPFTDPELEAKRLCLLGLSHLILGDQASYRQRVHQAAQIHQGFPTLLHLAYSLAPNDALAVLKEALSRATNPQEEGQAANALAQILEPLGRPREGLAYASLAMLRLPEDHQVVTTYVTLVLEGGDLLNLEALIELVEPIAESGEYENKVMALNLLADLFLLQGELQKALESVERNIALVAKDHIPMICPVAVRVYLALNRREKALMLIQAAQLTNQSYPRPQGHLQLARGLVLYPEPGAAECFEKAIHLYGHEVRLGSLIARAYLAEMRQETLSRADLDQLKAYSFPCLSLYPAMLRASQKDSGGYRLVALGEGRLEGPAGVIPLRPRGMEILVLMLSRPQGWTREALCEAVYGAGRTRAFRSEVYRMNKMLGDLIQARPWRVAQPVLADFLEVHHLLDKGNLAAAVAAYKGPLLPQSDAPGIIELRLALEEDLRQAVLARQNPDLLFAFSHLVPNDLELMEQLLEQLPPADWRRPLILSRVGRLRKDYL
jgi:tetratricopeptide (TPR) repeat protein